ncbi:unnamed protein product, partial [marine sediment metagenome]
MASIWLKDIAKHPGYWSVLWSPGEELKGGGIRHGYHITLLNPGKSFDRGA